MRQHLQFTGRNMVFRYRKTLGSVLKQIYMQLCRAGHCVEGGCLDSFRVGHSLSMDTGRAASSEQQRSARVPSLGPQGRPAEEATFLAAETLHLDHPSVTE